MEKLKKFELNNSILNNFDKIMSYHLDQVEELIINEILINSKLYNIIGLCTNLKTLSITGDLRVDVNKIIFSICNPEKLETLILTSVKLPTTKSFSKFTNLKTISLNNITFSDINNFFNKITNKDKIIALNLTNVDLGKKPISICNVFSKLKYLNFDNIKNCNFDDFEFIYENKKMERFEFYNSTIDLNKINTFCKGKYTKNINVKLRTDKECNIYNEFNINDGKISLIINSYDLDKVLENISFYKIDNLFLILENNIQIESYIRKLKKVKESIKIAIKDISCLNVNILKDLRDKLNVETIAVLDDTISNASDISEYYSISDYIDIREKFDEIIQKINLEKNDLEKFNQVYSYFKDNIKYDDEVEKISEVLIDKKCSYNFYATILNSLFNEIGIESKIISGNVDGKVGYCWNQVKLNNAWYNIDFAYEFKSKEDKKILKYVFKGNLFTDEQFYKNHFPRTGNPEECNTELAQTKKDIKKTVKKASFLSKIVYKLKKIFKINKKELPAPEGKHSK